jgi:selenocysteine lyase/cysteine desulfurase
MNPLGRRFVTGTPPFELLAGFNAAVGYLRSIGGYDAIVPYERELGERFVRSVPDSVMIYGLPGMEGRVPTFLINVAGAAAVDVARSLGNQDMGVWAHDSWYSVNLYKRLGYDYQAVRLGFIHYNTLEEVDRLVAALDAIGG